jgi:large subunit ribosomal protein L16
MLSPKRTKYRKPHRGTLNGISSKGNTLEFGEFALQALESAWITARQIEAGRRTITRTAKRGGKLYIRIFPHKSISARPAETRMGSGKGSPEYWVAVVKPGRILYEIKGVSETVAKEALRLASSKMPIKTKIISVQTESINKIGETK